MFEEIWNAYLKLKGENALPINLERSTPGSIKKECLLVLRERFTKQAERVLRPFVGQQESLEKYCIEIRRLDRDTFKPLNNLLIGTTASTEDKNIKLLAWLINFTPRPYDHNGLGTEAENTDMPQHVPDDKEGVGQNTGDGETGPRIRVTGGDNGTPGGKVISSGRNKNEGWLKGGWKSLKSRKGVGSMIVLFLVGSSYFSFGPLFKPKCMQWDKTQYKLVACDAQSGTTPVIKRNDELLSGFKKITDIESYRPHFLGRVWYVRVDSGGHEYYTDRGVHPIDTNKKLKPITVYHINKYLKNSGVDSAENAVAAK